MVKLNMILIFITQIPIIVINFRINTNGNGAV